MNLCVFHHSRLSMVDPPIDFDWASGIFAEQMQSLEESGLLAACAELHLGVSGDEADLCAAAEMAPEKANVFRNDPNTCGELPTMVALQQWLPGHSDWGICYFHTKGASAKDNLAYRGWRHCMENVVIWNWAQCVKDLEAGFDCVGPHWLTPARYPTLVGTPMYGGTMWWAKGSYLERLPQLSPTGPSRWEAEAWIGKASGRIRARHYADHWPGPECMAASTLSIGRGGGRLIVEG
jgi:hypothetical protein